jgi:hypothetical protein
MRIQLISIRILMSLVISLIVSIFSVQAFAQAETNMSAMSFEDSISTGNRAWTSSFFSIASTTSNQIDRGATSVGSYNYVSVNRRLTPDAKFSIRIPFVYNTSGFNKYGDYESQNTSFQDLHFVYSHYDIGTIGDVEVAGNMKLYLPTSDSSQRQKMITRLHPEAYFFLPIGRFSGLSYVVKSDYFVQSQTAYYDNTTPTRADGSFVTDPRHTTKMASLENYFELDLDITKLFGFQVHAGFDEDWYYTSNVEGLTGGHITYGVLQAGFEFRPMRGLSFLLFVENKPMLATYRNENVAFFRPQDNSLVLMTNAYLF